MRMKKPTEDLIAEVPRSNSRINYYRGNYQPKYNPGNRPPRPIPYKGNRPGGGYNNPGNRPNNPGNPGNRPNNPGGGGDQPAGWKRPKDRYRRRHRPTRRRECNRFGISQGT